TQEGKRYGKVNTLVIADGEKQKPTAAAIRESFAWFKQARERDLCILFIAGHAVNDSGGNYYFLPADAAFDGSGVLDPRTAISHREINAVLDMPGRKLFILDTCHSAGAGKAGIADANSFIRQAMEYYPVIFSSSRGSEVSLEKEEYRHGLFTYSIIKGLEGSAVSPISGTITMMSLNSYVSEIVSELSNGRQNPTTITPNGYVNFILAEPEKK
ncbi:MAG: caspase family protein, partial [Spirochaetaceae bacterium]|nr:caspase family protein [Spirochaetaceae bacterium]